MRKLRVWYYTEFVAITLALIVYSWLLNVGRETEAILIFGSVLVALLIGGISRKIIMKRAKGSSVDMGLKVVTLLKLHEDAESIYYEAHLLPNERTTKKQIIKDCYRDVQILASYHFQKNVQINVTTHKAIREAWIRAWAPYNFAFHETIENVDPGAGKSRLQWTRQMKQFYGQRNAAPFPKRSEWETIRTIIDKGGREDAARKNYTDKTTG